MKFWLDSKLFERAILDALRGLEPGVGLIPLAAQVRHLLRKDGHVAPFQILPSDSDVELAVIPMVERRQVRRRVFVYTCGTDMTKQVTWYAAA